MSVVLWVLLVIAGLAALVGPWNTSFAEHQTSRESEINCTLITLVAFIAVWVVVICAWIMAGDKVFWWSLGIAVGYTIYATVVMCLRHGRLN